MKLNDLLYSKYKGEYTYKLFEIYFQIYKYKTNWIIYETEEVYCGTPFDWEVLSHCETLKEAKKELISHIQFVLNNK